MRHSRFLRNGIPALALLVGAGFYIQPAAALTIGFDDLTDNGFGTPIANGYQGLNWVGWQVLNTPDFTTNVGPNGAAAGTVSPPNIAWDAYGALAKITSATPFTLVFADLTAFWNDGLQVTVAGYLDGVQQDSVTDTVSSTAPILETFDFANIDEIDISATGGTQNPNYSGAGFDVAVDNLTITPMPVPAPPIGATPASFAVVAAGLVGMTLIRRRRRDT
jgi:hypothetical protein